MPMQYFNSIKVRLEPLPSSSEEHCHIHFNSIKVRLERDIQNLTRQYLNFNSIKVRLEPYVGVLINLIWLHFNSIKVRLERLNVPASERGYRTFQFHKGAIRTAAPRQYYDKNAHFNSIKVQLERLALFMIKPGKLISIP